MKLGSTETISFFLCERIKQEQMPRFQDCPTSWLLWAPLSSPKFTLESYKKKKKGKNLNELRMLVMLH